jgi:hypothetical protein
MRAIQRLRRLRNVQLWASHAGRLDAAGELGSLGAAFVKGARAAALDAGCLRGDVDEVTIRGLEQGRCNSAAQTEET